MTVVRNQVGISTALKSLFVIVMLISAGSTESVVSGDTSRVAGHRVGQLVELPAALSSTGADAPSGVTPGYVVAMFTVGPSGDVVMATALAGASELRAPALEALRRWKFAQGRRGVTGIVSIGVGVPAHGPPQRLSPTAQVTPRVRGVSGGPVVIEVDVRADGAVEGARAVSGTEQMRDAAEATLLSWRYPQQALGYRLTVSVMVESGSLDSSAQAVEHSEPY